MDFNHSRSERIWKLLDKLGIFGLIRIQAEKDIKEFQLEVERIAEERFIKKYGKSKTKV